VLGDVDGLHESLDQVGDGAGGFGLYIATDNGGDEACQGGTEIAGGEVVAGKEVGQVFAFTFSDGRRCRTPRTGKNSRFCFDHAQQEARARAADNLWTERGHKSLLRVEFWDCLLRRAGGRLAGKPAVQNRNASRGREAQH